MQQCCKHNMRFYKRNYVAFIIDERLKLTAFNLRYKSYNSYFKYSLNKMKPINSKDIQTGLALISKDFQVDPKDWQLSQGEEMTQERAFNFLIKLVEHLMTHNFNHLLNSLYRIDVSEEKLKRALAESDNPAQTVADMIWERELQKVETRKRYSGS